MNIQHAWKFRGKIWTKIFPRIFFKSQTDKKVFSQHCILIIAQLPQDRFFGLLTATRFLPLGLQFLFCTDFKKSNV